MSQRTWTAAAIGALLIGASAEASELAGLYGWETDGSEGTLFVIDPGPPPVAISVGGPNENVKIAEIEWVEGILYGTGSLDNTQLYTIDPVTGLIVDNITMTLPPDGNVITCMEFVGDTMYAGLTTIAGGPTFLATIDLVTGVVTTIGPTGFDLPWGGLAWDGTTMYGIAAGAALAELFTVDLASGSATSLGLVTVDGATFDATGLEFSLDGILYAVSAPNDSLQGHLLRIDPSTAEATDLGDTEADDLVALTSPFHEVCESFDELPHQSYDFTVGAEPIRALFTANAFAGVPVQPFLALSPPQAWLTPPSFGRGVILFEIPVERVSFAARAHPWATFPTYVFAHRGDRLAGFDLLWPDQGWRQIEFTDGITSVTTINSDWGLFSAIDDLCYLPLINNEFDFRNAQPTVKTD